MPPKWFNVAFDLNMLILVARGTENIFGSENRENLEHGGGVVGRPLPPPVAFLRSNKTLLDSHRTCPSVILKMRQ